MKKRNRNNPVSINEDVWFYETDKTLQFVVWTIGEKGHPRQVRQFVLPKTKLRPYVAPTV